MKENIYKLNIKDKEETNNYFYFIVKQIYIFK